jgi:hypothetical protein
MAVGEHIIFIKLEMKQNSTAMRRNAASML